jgi:hypothetical protein
MAREEDQRLTARKRLLAGFVVTVLESTDQPFGEFEIESCRNFPQCLRQTSVEAVDIFQNFATQAELKAGSHLIRHPGTFAVPVARMGGSTPKAASELESRFGGEALQRR